LLESIVFFANTVYNEDVYEHGESEHGESEHGESEHAEFIQHDILSLLCSLYYQQYEQYMHVKIGYIAQAIDMTQ
jgi:hypothetical protein